MPKHTNQFDEILVLVIFRLFRAVGIPDFELAKVRCRAINGLENELLHSISRVERPHLASNPLAFIISTTRAIESFCT
jgi:hypothetical protein